MSARFDRALALLIEAHRYADQTTGDVWEFAVEIEQLRKLGLTENDLRYLVRLRLVDHASEVRIKGNRSRQFVPTGDLYFTNRTCFILTASGVIAAQTHWEAGTDERLVPSNVATDDNHFALGPRPPMPRWDCDRHLLFFDDRIVKRFKWKAANQEKILSVFEEEGWPARIDDPLAPSPEIDTKRRLSDTIKCLNRKQANALIRFRGDGTGQGVIWERAESHGLRPNPSVLEDLPPH
jgi:hypothetical protein